MQACRQKRLEEIGSLSLNVENEGSMKPKKKRSNALKTLFISLQLQLQQNLKMMKRYDDFLKYCVSIFLPILQDVPQKKKTVTTVQRWEENLFSASVDEKGIGVDERIVEIKMAF